MSVSQLVKSMGIEGGPSAVAECVGVTRTTLYNWYDSDNRKLLYASLDYTLKTQLEKTARRIDEELSAMVPEGARVDVCVLGCMAVMSVSYRGLSYSRAVSAQGMSAKSVARSFWLVASDHLEV